MLYRIPPGAEMILSACQEIENVFVNLNTVTATNSILLNPVKRAYAAIRLLT